MKMRRCESCGIYTLKEVCPKCGGKTTLPIPPKYSPQDRFGKYRRELRKEREKFIKVITKSK